MAFELVELDTVKLLESLAAVLAGVVVVCLGCVLLHVPVEGSPLTTLITADLTPVRTKPLFFIQVQKNGMPGVIDKGSQTKPAFTEEEQNKNSNQ